MIYITKSLRWTVYYDRITWPRLVMDVSCKQQNNFIPRNRYIIVLTRCLHRKLSPYGADINFTNDESGSIFVPCFSCCRPSNNFTHRRQSFGNWQENPILSSLSSLSMISNVRVLPFLGMILYVHVFPIPKVILYAVKDRYPSLYWLAPCAIPPNGSITMTHCIWFT